MENTKLKAVNDGADATDSWQSLAGFTQHPYRFNGRFLIKLDSTIKD